MTQIPPSGSLPQSSTSSSVLPVLVKEGMLRKQGGRVHTWKDRWFVLTSTSLSYFKNKNTDEPIKAIQIADIKSCDEVHVKVDGRGARSDDFYFTVATAGRVFTIAARVESERTEWVAEIRKVLANSKTPSAAGAADSAVAEAAAASAAESARKEEEKLAREKAEAAKAAEAAANSISPVPFNPASRPKSDDKPLDVKLDYATYLGHLKSLVRSERLSDLVFVVGDTRFHAHKAIVSARCAHLGKELTGYSAAPQEVVLHNITPENFSSILDFLYTDEITLGPGNVVDIHHAAVTYELKRLEQLTEVFIRDNVAIENVLTMLKAANRRSEREIERFCLGFVADVQRYQSVIRQKEATEIAKENNELYIRLSQVLAEPPESFAHSLGGVAVDASALTADFSRLLANCAHADLRIKTKTGELFAHRVLVAARCNNLLTEGSLNKKAAPETLRIETLSFPSLDSHVIFTMLRYLYEDRVFIERLDDTYGLIELADAVQSDSLVKLCNEMMRQNLVPATALKVLMVSSKYQLLTLKNAALRLIVQQSAHICLRKDLRTVLAESPRDMIDIVRALVHGDRDHYSDEEGSDEEDDDGSDEESGDDGLDEEAN